MTYSTSQDEPGPTLQLSLGVCVPFPACPQSHPSSLPSQAPQSPPRLCLWPPASLPPSYWWQHAHWSCRTFSVHSTWHRCSVPALLSSKGDMASPPSRTCC